MIRSRASGLVLCLFFAAMACDCRGDSLQSAGPCDGIAGNQPDHPGACADSSGCADHYACISPKDKPNLTCCLFADRKCSSEADCCAGQTCPSDRKKCFDKYLECQRDEDCGDKGDKFCESWTDSYGTTKRCRHRACATDGTCPSGQSCFKGECLADLPCGGSCPAGKACAPSVERCQDFACPASCGPGFIATFKNNRDLWDTCKLKSQACECAELPEVSSNDQGRFSALAVDPVKSELVVSSYDGQYGDLVVSRFDLQGQELGKTYVDGVPSNGEVKYGPSGARGGKVDPGVDVGRYTDVAISGDVTYVSYYDATNGDLKLAFQTEDGPWSQVKVDGASADLGLYSSIAINEDGLPGIAYFQRGGSADFNTASCPGTAPTGDKAFITALKLAVATKALPGAADFRITTLACQSRPPPPCHGCAQVCADPGTGAGCYPAATACATCDVNMEACVTVGGTAICAKRYNPANLQEVVDGVGLFPALAFKGNEAFIAYMRRKNQDGDLLGIRVSATGVPTAAVVLDMGGDTGYFPDLKLHPFTRSVALSYHDFTSRKLKFYSNASFVAGVAPEVIDSGAGPSPGESSWVGADSSLSFTPSGSQLFVAYQDATRGDLKLAVRGSGWEKLAPLRTEGAVGFFADAAFFQYALHVSHARIHARTTAGEPRVDNSLIIDRYTP